MRSSTIYNNQHMEATRVFITRRMDKDDVILYTHTHTHTHREREIIMLSEICLIKTNTL